MSPEDKESQIEIDEAWRVAWLEYLRQCDPETLISESEMARKIFVAGWCKGVVRGIKWMEETLE